MAGVSVLFVQTRGWLEAFWASVPRVVAAPWDKCAECPGAALTQGLGKPRMGCAGRNAPLNRASFIPPPAA